MENVELRNLSIAELNQTIIGQFRKMAEMKVQGVDANDPAYLVEFNLQSAILEEMVLRHSMIDEVMQFLGLLNQPKENLQDE